MNLVKLSTYGGLFFGFGQEWVYTFVRIGPIRREILYVVYRQHLILLCIYTSCECNRPAVILKLYKTFPCLRAI